MLKEASQLYLSAFSKLTVKDLLRHELAACFFVAKKTLIRKALETRGYTGEVPELPGEIAVAWTKGEEITAPASGVYEFGKKLKGAIALLGGVFEGAFADAQKMIGIATIPSMPVLRGMFANIINSPIQRFAIVINEVAKNKMG